MIGSPQQPQLALDDAGIVPLVPVSTVIWMLRRFQLNEDGIVTLVDAGDLVAWNIGNLKAESRELRIWAPGVEEFDKKFGQKPRRFPWHEIEKTLLPSTNRKWIDGPQIRRALNCSSSHITNLIEAKALTVMPGTTWKTGAGNSAQVTRESFIRFLKDRKEGGV